MYSFSVIETFTDAALNLVSGICDMDIVVTPGGVRLYTATRVGGGVLAISVGPSMVRIDEALSELRAPGIAPAQLEMVTLNGVQSLMVTGANYLRQAGYRIEADGTLGTAVSWRGTPSGVVTALETVVAQGETYLYMSLANTASVGVYRYIAATGQFQQVAQTVFGPAVQGVDVTSLLAVQSQGARYLVALSLSGDSLRSFAIAADGTLTPAGEMGAAQGLGLTDPKGVQTVDMDGITYLVGAATGSSSISVIAVEPDGSLRAVDHVMDTLDTRIQGVQALSVATVGDRVFVIAGGGDDGLNLFQMLPGGRLVLVATQLQSPGMALDNITAITSTVTNGVIEVFVAGEGTGITRLRLDPGAQAPMLRGGADDDSLTGAAAGDLIDGRGGNDVLRGEGGNDILIGGSGSDTLYGGAGSDLFVLTADGQADVIGDYQAGIDRIDLTGWGQIYTTQALTITPTTSGAILSWGGEAVTILSGNGQPIPAAAFQSADLFGVWHALWPIDYAGRVIAGTGGADRMLGGAGADTLTGSAGADTMVGGSGIDLADYSADGSGLVADLGQAAANTGSAAGDSYDGVEALAGGSGNDTLGGSSGDNFLSGGAGADRLSGGSGNDTLAGDAGDDCLIGGAGADRLDGGAGFDWADYGQATAGVRADLGSPGTNAGEAAGDTFAGIEALAGSALADLLGGDGGANVLNGRDGNDTLLGGDGNDTLTGGTGADRLDGGAGRDRASYAEAGAGLRVDLQFQTTGTGDAAGDVLVGMEDVTGTAFADVLAGDTGGNLLQGLAGADVLAGRDGNDTLEGGDGNDTLVGGTGADRLDGGAGRDQANYWDGLTAVRVDLQYLDTNTADAAGDILTGVEDVAGTAFADTLAGDGAANLMQGLAGNDILAGRGGADTLEGGDGNDTLVGGVGADVLNGGAGRDQASYWDCLTAVRVDLAYLATNTADAAGDILIGVEDVAGTAFDDVLAGEGSANLMQGLAGNDVLAGRYGDDTLEGGDGNDTLVGGLGADVLNGGAGRDQANYWDSAAAVRVDLAYLATNTADAAGDILISVEDLAGSAFDDVLAGDGAANLIQGREGNDILAGRFGNDTLEGGTGNDTLTGGLGADRLDGEGGRDQASYWDAGAGVGVDLLVAGANSGDAAGDVIVNVEDLAGSGFADMLAGDDGANAIWGLGGADSLIGRGGQDTLDGGDGMDTLTGGAGDDRLTGGAGADVFVFHAGRDVVFDFTDDVDTLQIATSVWGGGSRTLEDVLAPGNVMVTALGLELTLAQGHVLDLRGVFDATLLYDDISFI